MTIIAIDPGLTTGVAVWENDSVTGHEIHGRHNVYVWLRQVRAAGVVPEVVIETWEVRKDTHKKSAQVDPWRLVGGVEAVTSLWGWPFDTQTAAQGKGFGTDAKLKALGWYADLRTPEGHALDAGRHLLTYIARKHSKPKQFGHSLLEGIVE